MNAKIEKIIRKWFKDDDLTHGQRTGLVYDIEQEVERCERIATEDSKRPDSAVVCTALNKAACFFSFNLSPKLSGIELDERDRNHQLEIYNAIRMALGRDPVSIKDGEEQPITP